MTHLDHQAFRHQVVQVPDLRICPIIIIETSDATTFFRSAVGLIPVSDQPPAVEAAGLIEKGTSALCPVMSCSSMVEIANGAGFGFMKPQSETIIHYVSSGIPERLPGEFYCESPDELRRIFDYIDPRPAPGKFCVVKPLSQFEAAEDPELVSFFARPEALCGLHQLAAFVTNNPTVVASPWGAACGNLVVWPLKYLARGETRAVLGGWDPSARKFFKTIESQNSTLSSVHC